MKQTVVKIERIVPNGYGIGFAEGITYFVSLAAIGDVVVTRPREAKGKVVFAEIAEIIERSPDRIEPTCSHFGVCGGCDFQHLSYSAQLAAKVAILRDCLKRIGKIELSGEIQIIGSPQEFEYRSRAQFHLDTRKKHIGYFKRYSHEVVEIEGCPILSSALNAEFSDLKKSLGWQQFGAEKAEIEVSSAADKISVYSPEIIEPTIEISYQSKDDTYFYDANTFFQGNHFLIDELIEVATIDAVGENALDLYCGVGLFSIPLARKFKRVIGIESSENSILYARRNAKFAKLDNIDFHVENTAHWLAENRRFKIDFVLLDPPRTGAESSIIQRILSLQPKEIAYVSCDPATLARDLHILLDNYEIKSVTALDLFPQTSHVETVVRLVAKD